LVCRPVELPLHPDERGRRDSTPREPVETRWYSLCTSTAAMKDDQNIGHDEIALLLLKLVTGGNATDGEVAAAGPLAAPKAIHDDAAVFVPAVGLRNGKKGW
jgi:hypothetical protein